MNFLDEYNKNKQELHKTLNQKDKDRFNEIEKEHIHTRNKYKHVSGDEIGVHDFWIIRSYIKNSIPYNR